MRSELSEGMFLAENTRSLEGDYFIRLSVGPLRVNILAMTILRVGNLRSFIFLSFFIKSIG